MLAITLFFVGYLFTYKSIKTILVPAIVCRLLLVLGTVQLRREMIADAKLVKPDAESGKKSEATGQQPNRRYLIWVIRILGGTNETNRIRSNGLGA